MIKCFHSIVVLKSLTLPSRVRRWIMSGKLAIQVVRSHGLCVRRRNTASAEKQCKVRHTCMDHSSINTGFRRKKILRASLQVYDQVPSCGRLHHYCNHRWFRLPAEVEFLLRLSSVEPATIALPTTSFGLLRSIRFAKCVCTKNLWPISFGRCESITLRSL